MRKLILSSLALIATVAFAGCERSNNVLDRIPAGSQVTVSTTRGTTLSGQLAETRSDALVIRAANGAATTIPRAEINSVTVSTAEAGTPTPSSTAPAPSAPATAAPLRAAGQPAGAGGESIPAGGGEGTSAPAAAGEPIARWREVTVPAGTVLPIRLEESVASDRSRVEDAVSATLVEPITVEGVTAVPAGSRVTGVVTRSTRAGRVKGVAQLSIRFDSIRPTGSEALYRVRTAPVARRAATTRKKDALEIGAPAAGGALVGGLLGGKKGALVGGAVGGGAGTAVVLSTRGKEVRLPRGARLSIRLLEPMTVRVPA